MKDRKSYNMNKRLGRSFFERDVLEVAPDLLGKYLIFVKNNRVEKYKITEVEAYRGEEDMACHASKGRTKRTEIMYHHGGQIYVYLIYGMYWMLNFVTGMPDNPQAVLIRGVEGLNGPGKLTRELEIDKSFYGEDLVTSNRIWLIYEKSSFTYETSKRIGVEYAGKPWKDKPWRFYVNKF
jgi:DNA-3-methyladenine glycosylase